MATITACFFPILAGLLGSNQFIQQNLPANWITKNELQATFIQKYWPANQELRYFSPEELVSTASWNLDVVNQFLREHNFDIQLANAGPDSFYVASILKVVLQWQMKGSAARLMGRDKKIYPAVLFDSDEADGVYRMFKANPMSKSRDENDLLEIKTKNGDLVYMSPAFSAPVSDFELMENIGKIYNYYQTKHFPQTLEKHFDIILFPMVSINQNINVNWLRQLRNNCQHDSYFIAEALQQTKFAMDENGAKVESAFACTGCIECVRARVEYVFDGPFYLWIMRPGMTLPIFAAYIDYDCFKNPNK